MLDVRSSKEFVTLDHFDVVNQADEQVVADDNAESCHESPKRNQQKRMMTEDEIIGQAFIFLLAGYETSSNTLAFVCYLLAIHPECQKKVQRELDDFFSRHVSEKDAAALPSHLAFYTLNTFRVPYTGTVAP